MIIIDCEVYKNYFLLALLPAESAALGARARAAVLSGYTTEAMQAATIAVYRELIG